MTKSCLALAFPGSCGRVVMINQVLSHLLLFCLSNGVLYYFWLMWKFPTVDYAIYFFYVSVKFLHIAT